MRRFTSIFICGLSVCLVTSALALNLGGVKLNLPKKNADANSSTPTTSQIPANSSGTVQGINVTPSGHAPSGPVPHKVNQPNAIAVADEFANMIKSKYRHDGDEVYAAYADLVSLAKARYGSPFRQTSFSSDWLLQAQDGECTQMRLAGSSAGGAPKTMLIRSHGQCEIMGH